MSIEQEFVLHIRGRRVRLYLGSTSHKRRALRWRGSVSQGAYLRLKGEQTVGVQWRRT